MSNILSVLLGLLIEVINMANIVYPSYDIINGYLGKYNMGPYGETMKGNRLEDLASHPEIEGYNHSGSLESFWEGDFMSSGLGNFLGTKDSIKKALMSKYSVDQLRDPTLSKKLDRVSTVLSAARSNPLSNIFRSRRDSNFLYEDDYTPEMKAKLEQLNIEDIIDKAYTSNSDIGKTLRSLVQKGDVATLNNFLRNKVIFPALGIFRDKYAEQAGEEIFNTYNPESKSEDNSSAPIPEFPKLTSEDYAELEASYGPDSALAQVPSMNSIAKQIYNPNAIIDEKQLVDREISAYKIREAKRLKDEEAKKKAEYDAWVESLKPKRSAEAEAKRQRLMKELGF